MRTKNSRTGAETKLAKHYLPERKSWFETRLMKFFTFLTRLMKFSYYPHQLQIILFKFCSQFCSHLHHWF